MSRWQDTYLEMLDDCEKRQSLMSDWEATFVDNLYHWLDTGSSLSQKQIEKLENIWERVTRNG